MSIDGDVIQALMPAERAYSIDDFRKKFDGQPLPTGFMALARSAIAIAEGGETFALVPADSTLDKDGCDFIAACFYFLTSMGVPSDGVDFVLCLAGLSAGRSDEFLPLPDVVIAAVMGVQEQTVRRKRKALKVWMQARNFAVVEIIEGEFDWKSKKNSITQYRLTITPLITKTVLLARSGNTWRVDEPQAQHRALKEASREVIYETPEAGTPVTERKKKKVKNSQREIETKRKTIVTMFQNIVRLTWKEGHDPSAMWNELKADLQQILDEEVEVMTDTGGVF